MIKKVRQLYRKFVPQKTRKKIEAFLFDVNVPRLRRRIIRHLSRIPKKKISAEELEVLDYLKKNPVTVFPYVFTSRYKEEEISVQLDPETGLHYAIYKGKRLFFKRSWTEQRIRTAVRNLLIEQDEDSPHRYLTEDFTIDEQSTLADIGVAEGNFSLENIDRAGKVLIFESNPEWIEALHATFAPWKEKIQIINKWVADVNDEKFITLDEVQRKYGNIDFVKIDVDGFEGRVLNGSSQLLTENKNLRIALCTYHQQDDHELYTTFLRQKGFQVSHSKGYMIFHWGKQKRPYIRRGLIRAKKMAG